MKIELPDEAGNVISLEVVRPGMWERMIRRQCTHAHVRIDPALVFIECKDCGEKINPIEYIAMLAEEWHRITNLSQRYQQAVEAYKDKQQCKCQHCGKRPFPSPI